MVTLTKTKIDKTGDTVVMRYEGDITSTSESAVLGTYNALNGDVRKVLLDFSKVPYLNSSGIALVIQLLMAAGKASRKVVCFGLSAHFIKVFTMLGLAKYTTLHADEAAAKAAVA
jgi:anti-sigma B factor antagonist